MSLSILHTDLSPFLDNQSPPKWWIRRRTEMENEDVTTELHEVDEKVGEDNGYKTKKSRIWFIQYWII